MRREMSAASLPMRVLSIGLGVFFIAMSLNKVAWLGSPELLTERFARWLPDAAPYAQVYLRAIAIPGAPMFARIVPVGEFCVGLALLAGVLPHVAAAGGLFMIANFHIATSSYSSVEFLRDGTGPPMFAALLALSLFRGRMPFSAY